MDTVVFVDPRTIDFFTNEMVLAKIHAEKDTVTAQAYHVSGYPTLVMTDKDGNEIDRIVGYLPTDEFIKTLRDYKQGIGTLADLLNKAKDSTDRNLYFAIADKYKYRGGSADAEAWYKKVIEGGSPTDSLSGESRVAIADMQRRAKNYDAALASFQSIQADFKGTPFAEGAEIYTAIIYARKGDTAQAISTFEGFKEHYPKSEDLEWVQKQIDKLKNPPVDTTKTTKSGS